MKRLNDTAAFRCIHDSLPARTGPRIATPRQDSAPGDIALQARMLERTYRIKRGLFDSTELRAVASVDLTVRRGEVLAIVGESGCGKSTLSRLLLGLEQPDAGDVLIGGRRVASLSRRELARAIQPVFQDPRGSLNPRRSIAQIIRRPLDVLQMRNAAERDDAVRSIMEQVGLPQHLWHTYPSDLSGGQRQRVAIARALITQPEILLCDEPTSALDVSVQAQILNLLADLREAFGLTFVLITHDLSVVEHMADRVAVMYLGQIVEEGDCVDIFRAPQHPYTRALIQSALPIGSQREWPRPRIGAGFPNPLDAPKGCPFCQRCLDAVAICRNDRPERQMRRERQGFVACHLFNEPLRDEAVGLSESGARSGA
jgi:peptide/nickel transport system ATP-binding protein